MGGFGGLGELALMALVSSVVEAAQEETAPLVGLAEAQLLYPAVESGPRPHLI